MRVLSLFPKDPFVYQKVDNCLYRGRAPRFSDVFWLKNNGVNLIYDFRHKCVRGMKFVEKFACKIAGIKYNRLPFSFLYGELPTLNEFETVSRAIKTNGENGGKTFLHCNSGRHRTAQMVAFYDLTRGMPLKECKNNIYPKTYDMRLKAVLNNDILNNKFDYFNRKFVPNNTKNIVKYMRNLFNNRVVVATRKAYDNFLNMLQVS